MPKVPLPAPVPASKPRLSSADLSKKLSALDYDLSQDKVYVVGIRGYYRDTMGDVGENDRGIYDDAIFLVSDGCFISFNANTDPSTYRPGEGTAEAKKGMASLKAGLWRVHKFDKHSNKYLALCQRAGDVTVKRDKRGGGTYDDTGRFGINIHKGSVDKTSSHGCQTIHPSQWPEFIASAESQARRYFGEAWNQVVIPYVLLEEEKVL